MSNENFRTMMVAMLPLSEPMRSSKPRKSTMTNVYERPAHKRKGNNFARAMKQEGEES
jgi:hypothetical protein